ncbi:hypothetical protein BCR43DRAFT_489873 [Syncephalastrum racemosum]|uniref:Homeobox domain-containing protein n=1 Tax=Syncephalastrum racemosum TaxID=13706 RepID=A0A1X2HEV9_SYNRA|nr:hypothetical protein BCR43DRAFT_489873 [Syncephalastrum racemosum]
MSTTAYPFPPQQHHVCPDLKQEEDHMMCWYSSDHHYHHRTQEHHHLSFAQQPPSSISSAEEDEEDHHSSSSVSEKEEDLNASPLLPPMPLKAKRRRANAKQLEVLNRVFERTFFPSTQLRAELGRQLGMSPRTVQIWFQNRRQAIRTRERQRLLQIRDSTVA